MDTPFDHALKCQRLLTCEMLLIERLVYRGWLQVHSRCAILNDVGNGAVKDMINVYTEYTDESIAPLAVATITTNLNRYSEARRAA